jgi:aubergine
MFFNNFFFSRMGMVNDQANTYIEKIRGLVEQKLNPNLLLIILPNNRADRYSAIKKECLVNQGIPCQIVVKRSMNHKNVGSIATKIAIQINVKLGGIPWMIKLPIKGLMTVAFDVSIHPRDRKRSVGAMVATMDLKQSGAFYSITSEYRDGNEMNQSLGKHMEKALEIYKEECGSLPEKILFYRDGVGEGQVQYVLSQEVYPLISRLSKIYGNEEPKIAYIIVNKRINTRVFSKFGDRYANPKPGTVIDRGITLPGRNE